MHHMHFLGVPVHASHASSSRFGYRRVHQLLRREGAEVNHKKVYRLYREAGLAVRKRKRRKGVMVERQPLVLPDAPNHTWSMDFVMDSLANGRRIKDRKSTRLNSSHV